MKTTIVTALYDIDRHKFDGRKFEDYLTWFSKTLSINCSMVVFIPKSLEQLVRSSRKGLETHIVVQELEETPYFYIKDKMQLVIDSDDFREKMGDTNRIECKSPLYNCIQYSKFKWMKKASEICRGDYFIWMDAGLSRFFDNLDTSNQYPGPQALELLEQNKDKILLQLFSNSYPDLFFSEKLDESYFWDNRSFVMGGLFGGSAEAISLIDGLTENVLEKMMLDNNIANNEQIALGYLFKQDPSKFCVFVNQGPAKGHRNYELINVLSL